MAYILSAAITSFIITLLTIPSVIKIAEIKHLFDSPDENGGRKQHKNSVPTLGGVGLFAGILLSVTLWSQQNQIVELQYIITALLLMFFIGMKDDIVNLVAHKKLIGQIIAAFILVHLADIRINTFYGLFGLDEISNFISYPLSIIAIVGITNSFNLIDGVDGLAGTIGLIVTGTVGYWFFLMEQYQFAILSASVAGSLIAFLKFNKTPAKIFMGDTGSLIVGIVSSLLVIRFVEIVRQLPIDHPLKIRSAPVFALALLCIPVVDTLRVIFIRLANNRNPFSPDRNHLHHKLLDVGFSHTQTTMILAGLNIIAILVAYLTNGSYPEIMIFTIPFGLLAVTRIIISFKKLTLVPDQHPTPLKQKN